MQPCLLWLFRPPFIRCKKKIKKERNKRTTTIPALRFAPQVKMPPLTEIRSSPYSKNNMGLNVNLNIKSDLCFYDMGEPESIIKWKSNWRSIEMVFINHGISHHHVYYGGGGGSAVSRDFQQISGKFQSGPIWLRKWSDMASKVVRYGLQSGPL